MTTPSDAHSACPAANEPPGGAPALRPCRCCGLIQRVPPALPGSEARCARCGAVVRHAAAPRSMARAAAFALAALILYPPAMLLPVIEIERLGRRSEATIWSGVVELLADGSILVALVVLVCSIVIPLLKIGATFVLCTGEMILPGRHRAATYRWLEWIGRWGMVDVLLVALLVAVVKLGSWLSVHPGPGAAAFAGVVVLSLLASATFDPESIWESEAAT